jgi:hypothetical protein
VFDYPSKTGSPFDGKLPFFLREFPSEVSNVSFEDFDLDATDLGGNLTWALAGNEAIGGQSLTG